MQVAGDHFVGGFSAIMGVETLSYDGHWLNNGFHFQPSWGLKQCLRDGFKTPITVTILLGLSTHASIPGNDDH